MFNAAKDILRSTALIEGMWHYYCMVARAAEQLELFQAAV